jgi:hypothetical protein
LLVFRSGLKYVGSDGCGRHGEPPVRGKGRAAKLPDALSEVEAITNFGRRVSIFCGVSLAR